MRGTTSEAGGRKGPPAAEAWDLDWTAWVWGPEPKWLFQASPLGVPEGPPVSGPQDNLCFQALDELWPASGHSRLPWGQGWGCRCLTLPHLPAMHPVFFLPHCVQPWARLTLVPRSSGSVCLLVLSQAQQGPCSHVCTCVIARHGYMSVHVIADMVTCVHVWLLDMITCLLDMGACVHT